MTVRRLVSYSRRALLLLGFLTSCADSTRAPSVPGLQRTDPLVLIATSAATCEDGNQLDLSAAVTADAQALGELFPGARPLDLQELASLDLRAETRGRPLVVVYSGHGIAVREGERETSHLCLPGSKLLSTDELFEWIRTQEPKWATVILNGCETAQVNPAIVAAPPISVISASPSVVSPSSLPNQKGTDFVRVLASLIADARGASTPAPLDGNCDGTLSDRELFYALEARLRKLEWERETPFTALPVPKLRRNADIPLPLLYLPHVCKEPEGSGTRLPELATTIWSEREAILMGGLPMARKAFFILNGVRDHRACISGKANGTIARACDELKAVLEPVRLGSSAENLTDSELLRETSALARRSVGTEIYWLALDGSWAELRRLRDDGVVGVASTGNIQELVPRDERRLFSSRARGETWRFAGRVSWSNLSQQAAVPEVCRAPEGQCFRFPTAPTLTASLEDVAP